MKVKILKELIKKAYYYMAAYFTSFLFPIIKETFEESKQHFLQTLSEKIKEEAHKYFEEALEGVNSYFNNAGYGFIENLITDFLFSKIKLPFIFKPAKYVAKKFVKKEIRNFVSAQLEKLSKLNTKA